MGFFTKEKDTLEVMREKFEAFEKARSEAAAALETAKAKVAEANGALEAAADANDTNAFERAKERLTKAETGVEMARMRLDKLLAKGPATDEEIDAAVKSYESLITNINAKACREISDQVNALIQTVDAANREARQILKKEKDLCDLCGVEFRPVAGNLTSSSVIFAVDIIHRQYRLDSLLQSTNLQRYAFRAQNG